LFLRVWLILIQHIRYDQLESILSFRLLGLLRVSPALVLLDAVAYGLVGGLWLLLGVVLWLVVVVLWLVGAVVCRPSVVEVGVVG